MRTEKTLLKNKCYLFNQESVGPLRIWGKQSSQGGGGWPVMCRNQFAVGKKMSSSSAVRGRMMEGSWKRLQVNGINWLMR